MNNYLEGMKIDHIGIAVRDLDDAVMRYELLLGTSCSHREIVESEQVETAFFKTGESDVELLAASGPDSVLVKFLEKEGRGSIISHSELPIWKRRCSAW